MKLLVLLMAAGFMVLGLSANLLAQRPQDPPRKEPAQNPRPAFAPAPMQPLNPNMIQGGGMLGQLPGVTGVTGYLGGNAILTPWNAFPVPATPWVNPWTAANPWVNPVNPFMGPMANPWFNPVNPFMNPMNPWAQSWNTVNPLFNPMNPFSPWNPMNNVGPMNPFFNPMNPFTPLGPNPMNFGPMGFQGGIGAPAGQR